MEPHNHTNTPQQHPNTHTLTNTPQQQHININNTPKTTTNSDKEHSTIIYETPPPGQALLRLAWNKQDPRYMATFKAESSDAVVLDIR